MSSIEINAPEGVEFNIITYMTSDSTGLDVAIGLKSMKKMVELAEKVDTVALALAHNLTNSMGVNDWRVMTRDEIAQYKKAIEDEEG